jgi:hypothetical protein
LSFTIEFDLVFDFKEESVDTLELEKLFLVGFLDV